MRNKKLLTLKQRRFINEYLSNGGNGTEAALKVYNAKNSNSAHAMAAENLQKPTIVKVIAGIMKPEEINRDYVLNGIVELSKSNNEAVRLKALELLGKYHKMFTDRVDHSYILEHVKSIGWDDIN